ncbi:MAG: sigma 54-interacting transcriptional regulator [Gammaproteobacteria bacterium]|nr:MAG: sigma 54-interacting transcriptional regulator [Gammaproteobacteria bacterium]
MGHRIHFDELDSLGGNLELEIADGKILLVDQRMVLLHTHAMGSLRKELTDTLGLERARGVLMRMGYASGTHDADMVRRLVPNASDNDIYRVGPLLHTIEGIVKVTPLRVNMDVANGICDGEFLWENSYEADTHLEQFGLHHDPVCWMQIGYACGYTSTLMGVFVHYREIDCKGKGDRACRIIGKTLDMWEDEIVEAELKYYRPDPVADQLLELQTEVENLRYSLEEDKTFGDMVGVSAAFKATCELIKKVADSQVTVLLLGETGVGKEMFARSLHSISPRAKNRFVAVNCAAIPEELIESELFGVEKGAFTGAHQSKPGRFERAHGGTLFLDEVGELSPAAQAKLLRVLQDGEFERVGDTRTRSADVRVVAATNRDLEADVERGEFRKDLFYRLNTFPVLVPPLRERREDIPLLVDRFLGKSMARHGRRRLSVCPDALETLMHYEWPGNIRELENMIERGVIIAGPDGSITAVHLFPTMVADRPRAAPSAIAPVPASAGGGVAGILDGLDSLDDLEGRLLEEAVERSHGNLSAAARLLGITRPQLAYRLKKRRTP